VKLDLEAIEKDHLNEQYTALRDFAKDAKAALEHIAKYKIKYPDEADGAYEAFKDDARQIISKYFKER